MAGTLTDAEVKDLPPFAKELVALIGFSALIQLVEERPGVPVYIPNALPTDHWLSSVIGEKHAEALVKNYGGETITIPNCKLAMQRIRQANIVKSRGEGYSQTEAALLHGVTPRWVRELESRESVQDKNLSLF